jgi:hypothetical protein
MNLHYLERIRELLLQPNTHKLLPLGVESVENPYSGAMNTIQMEKTFRIQGKTPAVWYSHQCTPASHHSRCTPLLIK